eukprot:g18477.t1
MKMSSVLVLIGGSSLIAARYLRGDDLHEETASSSFVDYKKGMKTTSSSKKQEKKTQVSEKKHTAEYVTDYTPVVGQPVTSQPVVTYTRDDGGSLCYDSDGIAA